MPECFCGMESCHWCGSERKIATLEKQLAASKAREIDLRKALEAIIKTGLIQPTELTTARAALLATGEKS